MMGHKDLELLTIWGLSQATYVRPAMLAEWLGLADWNLDTKVPFTESLRWFFTCIDLACEADNEMLSGDLINNKNDWLVRCYGV